LSNQGDGAASAIIGFLKEQDFDLVCMGTNAQRVIQKAESEKKTNYINCFPTNAKILIQYTGSVSLPNTTVLITFNTTVFSLLTIRIILALL
jgi:hypothetical protein